MRGLRRLADNYFTKILLMLMIFALAPLIISGAFTYGIVRISMEDSAVSSSKADARQMRDDIDSLILQHINSLDILCEDEDINNLLVQQRNEDYYIANYKLALAVGGNNKQLAIHVVSASSSINATTSTVPQEYTYLYQGGWGVFRKADQSNRAVVHVNDTRLQKETGATLSIAKAVRDTDDNILGYVIIDIGRESLAALLPERGDSDMYIVDENNFVVFCSRGSSYEGLNRLPDAIQDTSYETTEGRVYAQNDGEQTAIVFADLPSLGFTIINEVPLESVTRDTQTIRNTNLAVIMTMFIICPLAAIITAKNTSEPIRKMTRLMKKVEGGDFSVRTGFLKNDEIGVMGRTFDHMTEQIRILIDKVEEEQRSLRIAQVQALQAQINPHFLYNTLDLIKYKAMLGETEDVAGITIQLGRMLRYLASFKEDFVEVSYELEFIYQYLDIQKRRYGERLHLVTDISPEIMKEKIPKLILQPAIENAIIHGLEKKLDGGELVISGRKQENYIVFIISDNGNGIDKERLEQLRREQNSGSRIGLNNVNIRARLYGGEHCGLDLQSENGVGTKVTITIPAVGKEESYDSGNGGGR